MKKLNTQSFISLTVNEFLLNNITKNKSYLFNRNLFLLIVSFILIVQGGICQQSVAAQKGNFGCTISSIVTADGYGTQFLPAVSYKRNRSTYVVGAVVQKQKMNLAGAQFTYEYTLVKEGDADAKRLELFCFVSGLYQANALLGNHALWNESMANPEYVGNASQLHFTSVEAYGGFGLRIRLFKNVQWVNSIGGGGYASFNFPEHLYYANHNFGLTLKTGISIGFKK